MNVCVIGGGASGLMASYFASIGGCRVTLFEKNEKLGKKLYLTGKGRCNLTNNCPPDEFLQNVVRGEKFLRGAIYRFPPKETMRLFEDFGLRLKTERGKRVFPASDHASDVTKTLAKMCENAGVSIKLNTEVKKINVLHSTVSDIVLGDGAQFPCDAVIVATGGLTYPSTGSTGDGLKFAKALGHEIVPCVPSLTGLNLKGDFSAVQGLTLKNVILSAEYRGKPLYSRLGEALFTHYGLSGPLVLSLSALVNRLSFSDLTLHLDLKPGLEENKLSEKIALECSERGKEQIKSVLRAQLPAGLCALVLRFANVLPERRAGELSKGERVSLVRAMKKFSLIPVSLRGFDEAVVCSGGVALSEIDPKTMQSKLVKGLYFCGETLDVDAFTGGFNLQIAFATGRAAGLGAAENLCKNP